MFVYMHGGLGELGELRKLGENNDIVGVVN